MARLAAPSGVADGTIIFAEQAPYFGLWRVSAAGGKPALLTTPNRERGEADHLWPEFLPGANAVLFTITPATGAIDNAQVAVLDLRTGDAQDPGAWGQPCALLAQRPSGLRGRGHIARGGVRSGSPGSGGHTDSRPAAGHDHAFWSGRVRVARDGTLVYVSGVWRSGRAQTR